jgi:hypothetical protein
VSSYKFDDVALAINLNSRYNFRLEKPLGDIFTKDETIWLTQKAMAALFDVESYTITYHLKEIYQRNELQEASTTLKIGAVQQKGNYFLFGNSSNSRQPR